MPNVVSVLREEIIRLARKEIRGQVGPLKKTNAELRRTVTALKGEVAEVKRTKKGFDVVVTWKKGFHAWGWDMFGEDRARDWCIRTRIDLAGLVPGDRRVRFAARVAGFDEAGREIAHVLTHAEPEAYHGRRYLHLQANAPRAEVSYKYRRVVFEITVQR